MTDSLNDRVAMVTGGSKGIGRAIALDLAKAGADVAICARNQAELDAVADELRATGQRAFATACDVTDAEQVEQLPDSVSEALGPVSILVNNAGAAGSHKFVDHPDELWYRMLEINLTSVYRVCKAFAPGMIDRKWGRIITVASTASKAGAAYIAAYTASKHGVLGLMRALAVELNPHNITVNTICPGYVDTPMTDAGVTRMVERTGRSEAEVRKIIERTNPQHRLLEPEEVARVALMLAGEAAHGITGQAINVDGGQLLY